VFSKQGQQIVIKDGFFPVSSDIVHKDTAALASSNRLTDP
jgi:hypothetical protein